MAKLPRTKRTPTPYTPAMFGWDQLPEDERPVFHIEPITVDKHAEIEDAAGAYEFDFDVDKQTGRATNDTRRKVRIRYEVLRHCIQSIDNLENEDGAKVETAEQLVRLIADMDMAGVDLMANLYRACTRKQYLEAGQKKS